MVTLQKKNLFLTCNNTTHIFRMDLPFHNLNSWQLCGIIYIADNSLVNDWIRKGIIGIFSLFNPYKLLGNWVFFSETNFRLSLRDLCLWNGGKMSQFIKLSHCWRIHCKIHCLNIEIVLCPWHLLLASYYGLLSCFFAFSSPLHCFS